MKIDEGIDLRRVAIIGFGEAGRILAADLGASGVFDSVAYDVLLDNADTREAMMAAARASQVAMVTSLREAITGAYIVVSAVTAVASRKVARDAAQYLRAGQYFVDINSVSPGTKAASAKDIEVSGADYIDAAVMASIAPYRLKVPLLLGGRMASQAAALLRRAGMNPEVISDRIGTASAIKMCRSVVIKGMEALMVECLVSARRYGVEDQVIASLDATFPAMDWDSRGDYLIGRVVEHGRRRAAEMREVVTTLNEVGLTGDLAAATARCQDWVSDFVRDGVVSRSHNRDFGWREIADEIAGATDGMKLK